MNELKAKAYLKLHFESKRITDANVFSGRSEMAINQGILEDNKAVRVTS